MKTILFPTDYSDAASNALQYTIQLAMRSNAKIILMHVYQHPYAIVGDVPVPIMSPAEIGRIEDERINGLRSTVHRASAGKIATQTVLCTGFVRERITAVAEEKNADLIVMGMKGHTMDVVHVLGNVTTAVLKKAKVPVLVVPEGAHYHAVKRIALAHDRKTKLPAHAVQTIREMIELFTAELIVINVTDPFRMDSGKELQSAGQIENALEGLPTRILIEEEQDNIAERLESFTNEEQCDWLVMLPHLHGTLAGIFHKSVTKQAAFRTAVPLLAIHE